MNIGLIADTHGLLRAEAMTALAGSDLIIHAGDVGDPAIIERLAEVAPVTVVRGNIDREPWASAWSTVEIVDAGGVLLYVLHDLATLDLDPVVAGVGAVIAGHSHKPLIERRNGVLFINPGSAGPRRFRLPVSVGRLVVDGAELSARLIDLEM